MLTACVSCVSLPISSECKIIGIDSKGFEGILFLEIPKEEPGSEVIKKVKFIISQDQKMIISYHFIPIVEEDEYIITIGVSVDGGKTFFSPKSVTGAIGKGAKAGSNLIEWNIFADVDELIGDVQIKVEADVNRSVFQGIFSASIEKKGNTDGRRMFICYPHLTFQNDTYKSNFQDGYIDQVFPFICIGVETTLLPMQSRFNFAMTTIGYSVDKITYNPDDGDATSYFAFDIEELAAPFPNIPSVTPFIGIGFSLSVLLHESGISSLSDLYYAGSLLITRQGAITLDISYKESIIRKHRKWSRLDLGIGVKF